MAFLADVKKKITAVQNTRKITQAMELVAASKMKNFQRKALNTRAFAWGLLDGLHVSHAYVEEHPFADSRSTGSTLFILLTSDKGLCGSLNQQLIRTLFRSELWKKTPPSERMLMTIGRKSAEAAIQAGIPVIESMESLSEDLTSLRALDIVHRILRYWEEKQCRQIIVIAPHYVNPFTFYPTIKTYLPYSKEMIQTHLVWKEGRGGEAMERQQSAEQQSSDGLIYFEPSKERLIHMLIMQLIETLFVQAFYELKACEYSSRMVAMKNATEAADEIIHVLTLEYHKARQSAITQQLAELAGANDVIV